MRILFFNWRDIKNPWRGGAEVHLHEVAKRLVEHGHEVTMLVGGYPLGLRYKKEEVIDGIKVFRFGGMYSIYLLAPFIYLWKFRGKFDLLIDTEHGFPFFTPLFTRTPKICVIHHIHTRLFFSEFPFPLSLFGAIIERNIVPRIYKNVPILTLSVATAAVLEELGFKNYKIINPGIEDFFFRKEKYKKFKNPTIIYLGRFRKYKRVELLVEIFSEILEEVPHARLIIIGDGHERENIKSKVKILGVGRKVRFLGFLDPGWERKKWMLKSHVVAVPSEVEGWGIVASEAAACGIPTVSFRVPGLTEAVVDGVSGFTVETRDEYKKALIKLLQDKKLNRKMGVKAKEWARKFTWDKATGEMEKWVRNDILAKRYYDRNYFLSFLRDYRRHFFHPVLWWRLHLIKTRIKPTSLFDVGCGGGMVVEALRNAGIEAYGLEKHYKAFFNVPISIKKYLQKGDILKIHFKDGSFDAVSCIDVLEHIPTGELKIAIRECLRVAKRIVYFDITTKEDFLFINSDSTHISKFTSGEWFEIIKNAVGNKGMVSRGPKIPFIHSGVFFVEKITC